MVEVDEGADSKKNVISGRKTCSNNCETSMNVQICLRRAQRNVAAGAARRRATTE